MSDNPLILQYSDGQLVPYQVPDPAAAAQRALDFTGIPDLAAGANALARGEWLPGLGQAASGAAGLLPLGKLAGAAKLGAELMPLGGLIKAWHGTPHMFEPVEHNPFGEFRDSAIGTGEGAQAYGHGHYVAGNPAVAEEYQRKLQATPELAGIPLQNLYRFEGSAEDKAHNRAINAVLESWKSGGSLEDAHGDLLDGAADWGNSLGHQDAADILKGWIDSDTIKAGRAGSLLEVHILPDEHELLDWDRPLGEQPERVRKVIDQIHAGNEDLRIKHSGPDVTGENFYRNLANQLWDKTREGIGMGSEAASKVLHEAGIPGIKYLDQGSRSGRFQIRFDDGVNGPRFDSREEAEKYVTNYDVVRHPANNYKISGIDELPATSNYVIFDPKNLRIVGRNGQRLEPVEEDPFK